MATPLPMQSQPPIVGGLSSVSVAMPEGVNWRDGVIVANTAIGETFAWSQCAGGYLAGEVQPQDLKPVNGVGDYKRFGTAWIGTIAECHVAGTQTPIGDVIRQTAEETLSRKVWTELAQIFHGGVANGGNTALTVDEDGNYVANPALVNTMQLATGFVNNDTHDLLDAITYLLGDVCGCFATDPVLHVPRRFMGHFLTNGLVTFDPSSGIFYLGPHRVSFDCYPNAGTGAMEGANPTVQDGSEVWIYATLPPVVGLGEEDYVSVLTHRQNNVKARVERAAIIAFDTTCVKAVKANL